MQKKTIHQIILSNLFTILISCSFGQSVRTETGIASYYHDKFVGRKTANGEIFTQDKLTAAHKSLPLGTWVKVTNLSNDSVVIVRINDRMPVWNSREIDLTVAAAGKLNYLAKGLTKVRIEVVPAPAKLITRMVETPVEPIKPKRANRIESSQNSGIALATIATYIDMEVYAANATMKPRRR
ncbi:MAG: septal ring lytic transglycosylase RlpA family protein [Chitinophagales bacterium]